MYEPTALKEIRNHLQHDQRLRQLSLEHLDKIRRLGLNNKPTKDRLHLHEHLTSVWCKPNQFIYLKKSGYKMDSKIMFATCNIQSLRYKELQVSQLFTDYALDFIVITETWLNSNHENWKNTHYTQPGQSQAKHCGLWDRKRRGISTNPQSPIPSKAHQHVVTKTSFESAMWET